MDGKKLSLNDVMVFECQRSVTRFTISGKFLRKKLEMEGVLKTQFYRETFQMVWFSNQSFFLIKNTKIS
jgi:hypothetical protein